MNELVKVDPKEYGLEETQATEITKGLQTILEERAVLIDNYKETIALEITEESLPIFKALRLQIVKNRTQGLKVWHKANKAYFLAGGNFVQEIYNKEVIENERMESQLMDAEKHFENLENERIEKLSAERYELCMPYVDDISLILPDLGTMQAALWDNYIVGLKASYEARKKEEKRINDERIEVERIDKLGRERQTELYKYMQFQDEIKPVIELGNMTKTSYDTFIQTLQLKQEEYNKKQEAIRLENERLHKEKKDEEAKKKKDEEKAIKEINNKIESRRLAAIQFLFDHGFKNTHGGMELKNQNHFIGANHYSELESEKEFDSFCVGVVKSIETFNANKEKQEALSELNKKQEAEQKAIEQEEALKQSELNKGDSEKVKDLINDLTALKTKYSFKSAKNAKMYVQVSELLDKVINHIEK